MSGPADRSAPSAPSNHRRVRSWLLVGLLGIAGLAVLHLWTPSDEASASICLSRRLLGLPCPGCGMTRALAHLAKGEWGATVAAHPFAPVLAAELLLFWLAWGARVWKRIGSPDWATPLLLANAALLLALWLGRLAVGALPR